MHGPKRVLVTGGVRRLGFEIAKGFARTGAHLALNYFQSSPEVAEATSASCLELGAASVELIPGDITTDSERVADTAAGRLGGLDVLVNNAGVFPPRTPLSQLTKAQFLETLGLNLLAPFDMTRSAVRHFSTPGSVVNLASLGGIQIWKERIDYNVSKSALITLTQALARELAPAGITVNAVAPGAILVESEDSERMGISADRIPLGRYGSVQDVVRAVLYFALDAPYVTGQVLTVDGGRSVTS